MIILICVNLVIFDHSPTIIDIVSFFDQAPIQVFGVEGRYAHALFGAASQKNSLDKVETELLKLKVFNRRKKTLSCINFIC